MGPALYLTKRQEIADHPVLAPLQHNAREHELVAPQQAPDPPRHGDTPARPAKRQIYSVAARNQSRSVMAEHQSGVVGKKEFEQFVSQPRGKSLSWDERANIERRQPESYGTRFAVSPQSNVEYENLLRAQMGL